MEGPSAGEKKRPREAGPGTLRASARRLAAASGRLVAEGEVDVADESEDGHGADSTTRVSAGARRDVEKQKAAARAKTYARR